MMSCIGGWANWMVSDSMRAELSHEEKIRRLSCRDKHDAVGRHCANQRVDFEDTTRVLPRKSAQVHQYDLTLVDEMG